MKKYLTIVLVVATLIFISPFSVSAGAEKEWSQKLDLSDSVSSSVIKLDDGIVVMRYEGNASENSTLTKYDFKGNQVWSIKNAYGYEMGALGDSFIVFTTGSEYTMTKISSDGKIVWSKTYEDKLYSRVTNVIELDSGFIMVASGCIYRYDNNGQRLKELYENIYNIPFFSYILYFAFYDFASIYSIFFTSLFCFYLIKPSKLCFIMN